MVHFYIYETKVKTRNTTSRYHITRYNIYIPLLPIYRIYFLFIYSQYYDRYICIPYMQNMPTSIPKNQLTCGYTLQQPVDKRQPITTYPPAGPVLPHPSTSHPTYRSFPIEISFIRTHNHTLLITRISQTTQVHSTSSTHLVQSYHDFCNHAYNHPQALPHTCLLHMGFQPLFPYHFPRTQRSYGSGALRLSKRCYYEARTGVFAAASGAGVTTRFSLHRERIGAERGECGNSA